MKKLYLGMIFGLTLAGCNPKALDIHILAANDFRNASDQAIAALRTACPSERTAPACRTLYQAQHDYVDAHVAFVVQLQHEARANHWRHPDDYTARVRLCVAHRQFAAAAAAVGIDLPAPTSNTMTLCGGSR